MTGSALALPTITLNGNACVGYTQTASTASGWDTYAWSVSGGTFTGNGTNNITITWTSTSGSVTVQGCNVYPHPISCSGTSSVYSVYPSASMGITISGPQSPLCSSSSANFNATVTNFPSTGYVTYHWYHKASNGYLIDEAVHNNSTNSDPFATSNYYTNDYVYCEITTQYGCPYNTVVTSNTITIGTITQTVVPTLSIAIDKPSACTGQSITFSPVCSNCGTSTTYTWTKSDIPSPGVASNSINYSPSVDASGAYGTAGYSSGDQVKLQVSNLQGDCLTVYSLTTGLITVPVGPSPTIPVSVTGGQRCGAGQVTLTATHGDNSDLVKWYPSGTINSGSLSPTISSTTTYQVVSYNSIYQCESPSVNVTATINPIPGLPSPAGVNNTCGPGIATLNATPGANGNSIRWYVGSGVSAPTATALTQATTPSISATTSFAMTSYNTTTTCESAQTPVVATVSAVPSVPSLTSGYNYGTGAVNLFGTTSSSTISWYGASSGGSSLGTGLGYTTPSLTQTTRYYAASRDNASLCESPRVGVDAVIKRLNAVITQSVQVAGVTTAGAVDALAIGSVTKNTAYIDGLGRGIETVDWMASPLQKDLNTAMTYDVIGRESRKYLPFASQQSGSFKPIEEITDPATGNYTGIAASFYSTAGDNIADDTRPFAQTVYEPSPLNRPSKQGAAGLTWQPDATNTYASTDHTIKKSYELNAASEVLLWAYAYSYGNGTYPFGKVTTGTPGTPAYYAAGLLTKNRTKDEQQNEVIEYVNTDGKTVLKRVQAVSGSVAINDVNYASTYYIYDDFLNLVCVIPPEASKRLATEYYQSGATDASQRDFLIRWGFRYRYDQRQRMILKQVPGADSVRMVYDKLDRLVFTQDGNQRTTNKWSYTEYDVLNRPIITGLYTHGSAVNQMTMAGFVNALTTNYETYNGNSSTHGYTTNVFPNATFPTANFEALTVTYYDNYAFKTLIADTQFDFVNNDYTDQYPSFNPYLNGQATGTRTKVLDQTTATYLWGVKYLDDKYRVIQTITTNAKAGVDRTTSVYDFPGKVLKTMTTHKVGTVTHTVARHFEYDHMSRVTRIWHKVDNQPDLIMVQNEYNELGQLAKKKLHAQMDPGINQAGTVYNPGALLLTSYSGQPLAIGGTSVTMDPGFDTGTGATFTARTEYTATSPPPGGVVFNFAQVIDYRYNIRGWLSKINNSDLSPGTTGDAKDLFGMELGYDTDIGTTASAAFNGNISAITWSSNLGLASLKQRAYNYSYDPMNRITAAAQKEKTSGWAASSNFSESGYTYDMNGNIMSLTRNGSTGANIDVLAYDYGTTASNQLLKVSDTADKTKGFIEPTSTTGNDYTYDANGSMITDQNKGIAAITYNHLNLPKQVTKNTNDYLKYHYDATGRKIRQEVYNPSNTITKKTDYDGEYIYENDTLKFINTEEGRVIMTGLNPEYQYHLKDHLGNVRTTFTTKGSIRADRATVETDSLSHDQSKFLDVDKARRINARIFDHTYNGGNPTNGAYSTRLTGSTNEKVGLAKSLSVMPGDTIKVEVFAKYVDPNATNDNALVSVLAAIASGGSVPAGTYIDGAGYATAGSASYPFTGFFTPGNNGTAPKAYLNYITFDKNFTVKDYGFKQVSTAARETGDVSGHTGLAYEGGAHERLAFENSGSIKILEPGYVYIWLSNENATPVEVFFDDFKVTHIKSPVISTDDYYPGGAMFNSYVRENSLLNKYKYQHKEFETDLGLDLSDFGPRRYDGWTLHTTTPDPHADKYYAWGPYTWAFGNPTRFTDPSGMDPEDQVSIGTLFSKAVQAVSDYVSFHFGSGNDGSAESANNLSEAHSTLESVGVEAQSMKTNLEEQAGQVPVLNVASELSSAMQSKSSGEFGEHVFKAAVNLNSIPVTGGGKSGGSISGHTRHGLNQSIGRDGGRGVSVSAKLDALRSPLQTKTQSGGRTQFVGRDAKVTLNSNGKVITATGKNRGAQLYVQGSGNAALRRAKSLGLEYDPKKIR